MYILGIIDPDVLDNLRQSLNSSILTDFVKLHANATMQLLGSKSYKLLSAAPLDFGHIALEPAMAHCILGHRGKAEWVFLANSLNTALVIADLNRTEEAVFDFKEPNYTQNFAGMQDFITQTRFFPRSSTQALMESIPLYARPRRNSSLAAWMADKLRYGTVP